MCRQTKVNVSREERGQIPECRVTDVVTADRLCRAYPATLGNSHLASMDVQSPAMHTPSSLNELENNLEATGSGGAENSRFEPPTSNNADDTSEEEGPASGSQEDTLSALGSFSPAQLSSRLVSSHQLPTSPSARSASRGRDGYGFRPPSGASTPLAVGIEGVRIQRGTAAVVDQNGLGWPGMFFPFSCHLLDGASGSIDE